VIFWKIINCGTEVLGADIYASETELRIVYHLQIIILPQLWSSICRHLARGDRGCTSADSLR